MVVNADDFPGRSLASWSISTETMESIEDTDDTHAICSLCQMKLITLITLMTVMTLTSRVKSGLVLTNPKLMTPEEICGIHRIGKELVTVKLLTQFLLPPSFHRRFSIVVNRVHLVRR